MDGEAVQRIGNVEIRKSGTELSSFCPAAEPSAENTEAEEDILPFGRTRGGEEVNRRERKERRGSEVEPFCRTAEHTNGH